MSGILVYTLNDLISLGLLALIAVVILPILACIKIESWWRKSRWGAK
jgi:hypothetical protein